MGLPQDYPLYLSARISAIEKVVTQLAKQHVADAENPAQALAALRKAVLSSLDVAPLNTGGVHLEPKHQEWLRRENAESKKNAESIFLEVQRSID